MSFHPRWPTARRFHKSERAARGRRARRSPTRRRTARRFDEIVTRYPPDRSAVGGAAGAVSRAGAAGLHHRATRCATSPSCSASRRPTSRTSSSYYTMFYTRAGRQVRAAGVPHAVVRAERRRARDRGAARRSWASSRARPTPSGTFTLIEVECLGACDRAPVVMVNDALARVPDAGGRGQAGRRPARARRGGAHRLPSRGRSSDDGSGRRER